MWGTCVRSAISYLRKGNTNTTGMTLSYRRRRFRPGRDRAERTRLYTGLLHCWWRSQGYQRLCEADWGGPWTHSTRITWASVRGPHAQAPPHPAPSETLPATALHGILIQSEDLVLPSPSMPENWKKKYKRESEQGESTYRGQSS